MIIKNHFAGALIRLAVGDALGTTLEFKTRGSYEKLEDMVGGGPFDLEPRNDFNEAVLYSGKDKLYSKEG